MTRSPAAVDHRARVLSAPACVRARAARRQRHRTLPYGVEERGERTTVATVSSSRVTRAVLERLVDLGNGSPVSRSTVLRPPLGRARRICGRSLDVTSGFFNSCANSFDRSSGRPLSVVRPWPARRGAATLGRTRTLRRADHLVDHRVATQRDGAASPPPTRELPTRDVRQAVRARSVNPTGVGRKSTPRRRASVSGEFVGRSRRGTRRRSIL